MRSGALGAGADAGSSRAQTGEEHQLHVQHQQQHISSVEALLDDAKTSNRLLSRALAAVQVISLPLSLLPSPPPSLPSSPSFSLPLPLPPYFPLPLLPSPFTVLPRSLYSPLPLPFPS